MRSNCVRQESDDTSIVLTPLAELAFVRAVMLADLRPAAKTVAVFLISRFNRSRGGAWPALSTIARECEIHERTAKSAVSELEEKGWFLVERGARSSLYQPALDRADDPWRRSVDNVQPRVAKPSSRGGETATGEGWSNGHPIPSYSSEPTKEPIGPAVDRQVVDIFEERPFPIDAWRAFTPDQRRIVKRLQGLGLTIQALRSLDAEQWRKLLWAQEYNESRFHAVATKLKANVASAKPSRPARTMEEMQEQERLWKIEQAEKRRIANLHYGVAQYV